MDPLVCTHVIVGSGPAGSACAFSLLRVAREEGDEVRVIVVERGPWLDSETHTHRCAWPSALTA